jgi:hypothetical protein
MKGSKHNLAHYTMILRKVFKSMHMQKQVIVTVHKQGLKINPLVNVRMADTDTEGCLHSAPSLVTSRPPYAAIKEAFSPSDASLRISFSNMRSCKPHDKPGDNDQLVQKNTSSPHHRSFCRAIQYRCNRWYILILIIAAIFLIAGTIMGFNHSGYPGRYSENNLRLLTDLERCKIYTFNSRNNDDLLIKDVLGKVRYFSSSTQKVNCKEDRVLIYSTDVVSEVNINDKKEHASLTLCTPSSSLDDLNSCISHYFN